MGENLEIFQDAVLQFLPLFAIFGKMEDLLRKGIEEFNTRCFFEAHDTWEELWRETSGDERLFYQGLIQTAVGLYHLENGNFRGASSQFSKALSKLELFLPSHHGINTEHLTARVRECLRLADVGKGGSQVHAPPELIPHILVF